MEGAKFQLSEVAEDEDVALYATLSIACMKTGIHRNPES